MSLRFDNENEKPKFAESAKAGEIDKKDYVVYYSPQCPYTLNCLAELKEVAIERNVKVEFIKLTNKEQAKTMPCVFNNFAVFYNGKFITHHLLNKGYFEKLIDGKMKV